MISKQTGENSPLPAASGANQDRIPPQIPDHALFRCIGRGSYGEVWLAKSVLGTYRAVKIVYRQNFEDQRPFQREFHGIQKFEPVSRLHEGLIDLLQIGQNEADGYFYYVMELADDLHSGGEVDPDKYEPKTLQREFARREVIPPSECVALGLTLTTALGNLHQHGLVHRDIKPSNIIFVNGAPKLADIGLVTGVDATLSIVGTRGFMAPEGPGTTQADIYSLGKVLYEMCTGKDRQQFPDLPTDLRNRTERKELLELNEVLVKACANNPSKRYANAKEMQADLAVLHSGRSVKRLRVVEKRLALSIRVGFVGAIITLITLGGYFLQRDLARKAEAQARRAEETLVKLEIQRAQELLDSDHASTALAILASVIRQHPTNTVAVQRLMSALVQRNFCLPVGPPLKHRDRVYTCHFNPTGEQVLTASVDGTAALWDWRRGERLFEFTHTAEVVRADFSQDGRLIATASMDHFAKVWDAKIGTLIAQFQHEGYVYSALFDREGKRLLTASPDRSACVWEAHTGRRLAKLDHPDGVPFATFSPDDRWIASATWGGTAWLWDARTYQRHGNPIRHSVALKGDTSLRYALFSPDSRFLVTVSNDGAARVWDVMTGLPFGDRLQHERQEVFFAQFNRTSRRLVTVSHDYTARIWDLFGSQSLPLVLKHDNEVWHAEFSLDGERMLTACRDGTARLWNSFTGEPVTEPFQQMGPIRWAQFSPDGKYVVTASDDSTAQVWDVRPSQLLTEPLIHTNQVAQSENWVRWAEFSPDSQLVVTASEAWTACVWDAYRGQAITRLLPHDERVVRAMFSPNGRRVLTASLDKTAQIWDATTGSKLGLPLREQSGIFCARFSRNGDRVVTAAGAGQVQVWNGDTCERVGNPMLHKERATWAEFSADGMLIASSSFDKTARVWDARTGKPKTAPLNHSGWVHTAHFSSDGRRVVTASEDKTARIWDVESGLQAVPSLQHNDKVRCAEFSGDGTKVVTGCGDHYARVWDALTGKLITVVGHKGEVFATHFSASGDEILTASEDSTARLWDVDSGFALSDPLQHADVVMDAAFSPNGKFVVTASQDNTARVWELPLVRGSAPDWLPSLAEAIAGRRLDETGVPRALPAEEVWNWENQINAMRAADFYTRWARWLFSDRGLRPIFPSSGTDVHEYVRRRAEDGNFVDLTIALRLAPTNALALARLAVSVLPSDPARKTQDADRAEAFISRALELDPSDARIVSAHAEVMKRLESSAKTAKDASPSK